MQENTQPMTPQTDMPPQTVTPLQADTSPQTATVSQTDTAPYRPSRTRRQPSRLNPATWTVIVGGLVAILLLLVGVDALATAGKIHPGVNVGGVDVGGLTQPDAVKLLQVELAARLDKPVTARYGEKSWTITAERVGASIDATKAAGGAYAIGRGKDGGGLAARLGAWVKPVELSVPLNFDEARLDALLTELNGDIARRPRNASIELDGTKVRLVPSKDGTKLRREDARRGIMAAFVAGGGEVELTVDPRKVAVDDAQAKHALEAAKTMVSSSVRVTYEKRDWTFSPDDIASWIRFRKTTVDETGSAGTTLEAYVHAGEMSATVGPETRDVGRAPKDARFVAAGGKVTIVPSEVGAAVDMDALARSMTVALRERGEREVPMRLKKVTPDITTSKARGMGVTERISTYTTEYAPGNKARVNNIHTLAKALDGTLVAPGETFSFNGSVGPRTAEAGYQEANAIVNGKLVPQLGGGVCQVGTTVFNAAFFSGLPVIERRNHSFYFDSYPKGRDASVSWGGPDLKFKNTTDKWILIRADYSPSSVTISLYGTNPGYDVSYTTGTWSEAKPFPVKEIRDKELPRGVRVVEDVGIAGGKLVVVRTVKRGGKVVSTDTFTSIYRPKEQVVRVGTKVVDDSKTEKP